MNIGKVMSFRPDEGTLEILHEMPTRASVAWKMEEMRTARRTEEVNFILIVGLRSSRTD
jgi:hypothetical protein